jgi:molecular chaperone HscB
MKKADVAAENLSMSNVCWACDAPMDTTLFCSSCHKIQAPKKANDAFQYLEMPYAFNIDLNYLQQHYFKLQHFVHPDRYSRASTREKSYAEQHASFLNKAYEQLKDPIYRAEILLKQHNLSLNTTAQEVLMTITTWQEKIAEAKTAEEFNRLLDALDKDCQHTYNQLNFEFTNNKIADASVFAGTLQYLLKVHQQLMQKMHP